MKVRGIGFASVLVLALSGLVALAPPGQAQVHRATQSRQAQQAPTSYVAPKGTKINVMGEWAHPDDDTSIIGPCGVWHQQYGTRCGVVQVTRGEGGGNATGTEAGQALGLRRENEDRVAHYRSGTIDMFYVDRVDFFYNQSAPLTNRIWDHEETLRRVTRIVRTTQPDVFIGWTPTLAAGHGNHQESGRLIWEAVQAAADPSMFPEQLTGPDALSTWQVKKIYSGGDDADAKSCVSTGIASPYRWPAGNVQGEPAGSPKIWQQVADEGRSAYPTQSRVMWQDTSKRACRGFALTDSDVPFRAKPPHRKDASVLEGAQLPDPGGLPLGTLEYLTFSRFYVVPGESFTATLHLRSGAGTLPAGTAAMAVPSGWTVSAPRSVKPVTGDKDTRVSFTVTPPADAEVGSLPELAATYDAGGATGHTDDVVSVVAPAEGRFHRWGKWKEYDAWLHTTPAARRLGRSGAEQSVGLGGTMRVPVDVHNWSATPRSGTVSLDLPSGFTSATTSKPYGPVAPGKTKTVTFEVRNTQTTLPENQQATIPIATTSSGGASSTDDLLVSVVPTTTVPEATTTPVIDGKAGPGEYAGPQLDVGRVWQGDDPDAGSWAKASWHDDALYLFAHIRDDYQSYAIKPGECMAHWLADSVEFQVDPRGRASRDAMDTAETFKLGVFPFTDDASRHNGPCWERDADQHQGDASTAPGVQVASTATWVGSDSTTVDHAYAGGGYELEVKIPMADLPAAVDPQRMGLNITPYDNDDTSAPGTTTLRHIDQSTRTGWSAFNSVQSDPYRWGLATLPGYTPPVGRSTTPEAPVIGHSNLDGTESPQTIAQSARDGVPIAGRTPAPDSDRVRSLSASLSGRQLTVRMDTSGAGTAQVYAVADRPEGPLAAIPVWTTSCPLSADPPPDHGLSACAESDGSTPPWSPDMAGHLLGHQSVTTDAAGTRTVVLDLTAEQAAAYAEGGSTLVSWTTPAGEVQALAR